MSHQDKKISKSSNAFEQLMSYVSEEKKGEINKKIDRVESSSIEKVENIVASHCFEGIFFDEEFEFYGLALVKAGRLSAIQFGTLMAMRAALSEGVKSWEVVSLFEDESISIRAWALLSDTLFYLKRSALTRKELSRFFECMRKQPVSEQFFLLVPDEPI